MDGILMIVSLALAIFLVNWGQKLFMKILGIDTMYFSVRAKLGVITFVFIIIFNILT